MKWYRIFLINGYEDVEADMVRTENNYFTKTEGQQPTVCFYRGHNPTKDYVVAEFVYKNISGYREITKEQHLLT